MTPTLGELRNAMHQRFEPDVERFGTDTYFEEFLARAFDGGDAAERFHENTKYVPGLMEKPRRSVAEFERPYLRYVQSVVAPDYRGNELIELPDPPTPGATVAEAMRSRRSAGAFADAPVGVGELSGLLGHAAGVTGTAEAGDGDRTKSLRAYPSAGALYPVEVYVAVRDCDGLEAGLYYYAPERHGLRVLERDAGGELAGAFVADDAVPDAPVVVVLTGAFWRSKAKYGPRGYRYTLQESGHVAGNLGIVAESVGLCSVPVGGFYDDRLNERLGVDGVDEAALYAVAVGAPPQGDADGS